MIKKISQLDKLPLSCYEDIEDDSERKSKLESLLLEISHYEPGEIDEGEYWHSYQMDLSAFKDIIGIKRIETLICTILDGGLSAITCDLLIGIPGETAFSDNLTSDNHKYYPNDETEVKIFSKSNFQNNISAHGKMECHNSVLIRSEIPTADTLSVQGVAHFEQVIQGTAYRAQWGDVAEVYVADREYEPGTLVKFGGDAEITIADDKANAVVSTKPGFLLNGGDVALSENPVYIALAGRVPVKVVGSVDKFDNIVLSKDLPGVGIVYNSAMPDDIIAKALESNQDYGVKTVLCSTKFNLA